MGRAKVSMKLIECPKSRNATFLKRRKGLKKKVFEFATLCDVDACLICLGPQGDRHYEPEIWPDDTSEIGRILKRYENLSKDEQCRRKLDLSGFIEERKKKLEDELKQRSREADNERTYPSWDDPSNEWTKEKLLDLLATLDTKLEAVNINIEKIKYENSPRSSQGKELSIGIVPKTYPNQVTLDMNKMVDNDESMVSQPLPTSNYLKPLNQCYMPKELLPCIPNIPNYCFSSFNTRNNNSMLSPPLGYYVSRGIGTSNANMFHHQSEFCDSAECLQRFVQFQSSVAGSPPSTLDSNSGSLHGLLVHQARHMNGGFSEFQMFQTKRERD